MGERDATEEEWQGSKHSGDPRLSQLPDASGLAPVFQEGGDQTEKLIDGGRTTESGDQSMVETGEPSMVPPRLIPAPHSPSLSAQLPPEPTLEDTGHTSESLDRKFVPSRFPVCGSANYDQMSYRQLHKICKQRGYHDKDAKAVHKTRLVAMDAANRRTLESKECDMGTSSSVFW